MNFGKNGVRPERRGTPYPPEASILMATRTQIQIDATTGCIHEQLCQAIYEWQRERIQALCAWMSPDAAQARSLAFAVFVEAWRQSGQAWQAVSADRLAESFAARFRWLFHTDVPAPAAVAAAPRLVGGPAQPVREAVSALPTAHRLLYLLHELEGYPAETLADWLDLEPSQCAHMIHEARLQLRRQLRAA